MENRMNWPKLLLRILSYVLVAVVTCVATMYFMLQGAGGKLTSLRYLINTCFIGEVDQTALEDGAANGMVQALPDRWSYYIPASGMQANQESLDNAYVGVGITITVREDKKGYDIVQLEPTGGAIEAGILPGDILVGVEDRRLSGMTVEESRKLIRGEEGTQVNLTVERGGEELTFAVTRKQLLVKVATGQLLEGNVGYITIANFNDRCAQETIAQIEELKTQGATSLIFDVRFNPGGFKDELVDLLDYLLPEGDLFRSLLYTGEETVDTSDEKCLEMPMMVLINGDSYSAAEFFAAALSEYEWAQLVGESTVGKGYFQYTMELGDGSAVALSVGKYFTPKGRCLEEEGGLEADIPVKVDEETAARIYAGLLDPMEDPQVLAALEALKK